MNCHKLLTWCFKHTGALAVDVPANFVVGAERPLLPPLGPPVIVDHSAVLPVAFLQKYGISLLRLCGIVFMYIVY